MDRYGDPHREHKDCCHHCDGRHHRDGKPYVCAPHWFGQAGAQRIHLVTCQVHTPDGVWEYSEALSSAEWEHEEIRRFAQKRVELEAMRKYWATLDVSNTIRELDI